MIPELISSLYINDTERVVCPSCSPDRKKHRLKELIITRKPEGFVYHCHHCGIGGIAPLNNKQFKIKEHNVIPLKQLPSTKLETQHYDFLQTRGISARVADEMKLFPASKYFTRLNRETDAIGFPYFRNGVYISAKYRSIESKDFTQDAGGAHDFFGIDHIDTTLPVVIVEGEIDALTLMECGIKNVLSVPSGAPMKVTDGKIDASEDKRFAFVWNAFDMLKAVPYVTIATDTDTAGQALAEELARRIGKDKCRIATFSYKDLNEAFLDNGVGGADIVKGIIDSAEPYPVAGLSSANKYLDRLNDLWGKGNGKGTSTGYSNVDQIYTIAQGQLTIVTGYPSSGKSNFVDQLMVNLAREHDWKFAICSFENQPEVHISRLMEINTEKRFFDGNNKMSEDEKDTAFKWVENHFLFLDSEGAEPSSIDSILERARIAVARTGIRGLVIDPYNYIENKSGVAEHEFISHMLTRMQQFAKAYGVHVWFVAHPSKITRSNMDLPRPDGMAISGSMAWWAKADCGITVHRKGTGADVEIYVWKCRYRWIGSQGETILTYNRTTGTYFENKDAF